jgi:capsular exopolysaccharide synthesis family protein
VRRIGEEPGVSDAPVRAGTRRHPADEARDPDPLVGAIGRRAWVVALFVVLTAGAAYSLSGLQQRKYEASSSLLFGAPDIALQIFPNSASQPGDAQREAETNVRLVESRTVAARVARRMPGLSTDDVVERITASQEGQSDAVKVTATDTDPRRAAELANTYAAEFVGVRRGVQQSSVRAARRRIAAAIAALAPGSSEQARQLRRRDQDLAALQAVVAGDVKVLDRAEPPSAPSSPKTMRSIQLGAFAGLLLGLGAALWIERVDRRVRRPSDIEQALGVPLLATIPRSRALAKGSGAVLLDPERRSPVDIEPFRALRAKLRFMDIGRPIRSILVTSAARGEGKSTVSVGLAAAAAAAGDRVLLIEADWRSPALSAGPSENGLSLLLAGAETLDDAVVEVPVPSFSGGTHESSRLQGRVLHLDVLPSGPPPENPDELIESAAMVRLIADAEARYDMVVIDTPAVSVVADAFALVGLVSGVIIVTRLHHSTREAIGTLDGQLSGVAARVLGVVVNGADRPAHDGRAPSGMAPNGAVRPTDEARRRASR